MATATRIPGQPVPPPDIIRLDLTQEEAMVLRDALGHVPQNQDIKQIIDALNRLGFYYVGNAASAFRGNLSIND